MLSQDICCVNGVCIVKRAGGITGYGRREESDGQAHHTVHLAVCLYHTLVLVENQGISAVPFHALPIAPCIFPYIVGMLVNDVLPTCQAVGYGIVCHIGVGWHCIVFHPDVIDSIGPAQVGVYEQVNQKQYDP